MILTEVANELAQTTGDAAIERAADDYAMRVMNHFVRAEHGLLVLEFLDRDYNLLPGAEGAAVMPGHGIESMWFVLHWARRKGREDVRNFHARCSTLLANETQLEHGTFPRS